MLKRLSVFALSAVLAFGAVGAQAAEKKSPYWQCVTFARSITGMNIFGDAWTWWDGASGKYDKGQAPKAGAVLVFRPQGKMRLGHVAVVSQVVTERVIQITHANWSPIGGRRGQVEKDVTVVDVSDKGDWSKVKVWYGPIADVGTTVYPTYGFIYQAAQKGQEMGENLVTQVLDKPTVKKPSSFDKVAQKTSSKASNKALATALTSGAVDAEAPRSQTLASASADEAPKTETPKADAKTTEKAKATADKASDKKASDKKVVAKKASEKTTKVADAAPSKSGKSKSAKSEKTSSKKTVAEVGEKPALKNVKAEKAAGKKVAEAETKKTEKKKA
ncbi:CHAP domain-containing protein [Asticcacaulis sp. AND118]|uniref:CHAP domain-containing protein n=1 Tax=Asticcacaulis sp. AND118 TaxID=2840468 RepID=UPI00351D562A